MKNITKKIILSIILFIFVLILLQINSYAGDVINTNTYKANISYGDASYIFDKGATIIATLRNIAAIISVFVITIIGIKYMIGSLEERAEYKKTMGPVIIACILITCLSEILTLIASTVS